MLVVETASCPKDAHSMPRPAATALAWASVRERRPRRLFVARLRIVMKDDASVSVWVRAAFPGDLDAIVAVNRAAATQAYGLIFADQPYPEKGVRARYQRLLGDRGVRLFVAEEAGSAVGYAAARPGRIEALYVVPEQWGTGVADVLYERVAEVAGSKATLWVLHDNVRGRRFWERRGWRATGEEDRAGSATECLYRRTE